MVDPTLLRVALLPKRDTLQPELPPVGCRKRRIARHHLLEVLGDMLQEARIAQIDIGRDTPRLVVEVR